MNIASTALLLVIAILMAGCSRIPDHTQEEYDRNPDLAKARSVQCSSMTPADRAQDQDCAFALAARLKQVNSGSAEKPKRDGWYKN